MPTINTMTGGYSAPISISSAAYRQILSLGDGETAYLNDARYVRASRSGDLVVIAESSGRTYDIRYRDL